MPYLGIRTFCREFAWESYPVMPAKIYCAHRPMHSARIPRQENNIVRMRTMVTVS